MTTINLRDNSTTERHFTDNGDDYLPLLNIANRTLSELAADNGNLLVYPRQKSDIDDWARKENLLTVKTTIDNSGHCTKMDIKTGNVAGFIGVDDLNISISSRFRGEEAGEDFFLQYMLEKTLGLNVVNMMHATSNAPALNLLLYLFPKLLNDAMAQGLYKEYRRNEYNDANVRGTVDISRHIRNNIPFCGRIAYRTREFSHNNNVTQLIRHTIEYIQTLPGGRFLLENDAETRANISQIITATTGYCKAERGKIMMNNSRPVRHPYFTGYAALQKLCLRILRHERTGYGETGSKIYGIIFDVSELWEEYLAGILQSLGFEHPDNRKRTGGICLVRGNKFPRYPDYHNTDGSVVIDAKYKPTVDTRLDVNQMVTYMYRLKSKYGLFINPCISCLPAESYHLKGYGEDCGAELGIYHFEIPQSAHGYATFKDEMKKEENRLKAYLASRIQHSVASSKDAATFNAGMP